MQETASCFGSDFPNYFMLFIFNSDGECMVDFIRHLQLSLLLSYYRVPISCF